MSTSIHGPIRPMTLSFAPERIETWPLARLQPYAKNAKVHGADQVAKIAASMAEFGWTVPCLVAEDGELIAGHGRVLAATQLGLTQAPVIVLGHLTEAQRRAYRIADNKLTEVGSWDEALLSAELQGCAQSRRRRAVARRPTEDQPSLFPPCTPSDMIHLETRQAQFLVSRSSYLRSGVGSIEIGRVCRQGRGRGWRLPLGQPPSWSYSHAPAAEPGHGRRCWSGQSTARIPRHRTGDRPPGRLL